ncbi:MAG: hypothetical protein LZF61_02170 [Nitrosomonas sp.]|nr:MAG: hypothetical protein LZF61_02170 [Nitrosomonas sp.]
MFFYKYLIIIATTSLLVFSGCSNNENAKIKDEVKKDIDKLEERAGDFFHGLVTAFIPDTETPKAISEMLEKRLLNDKKFSIISFVNSQDGSAAHLRRFETTLDDAEFKGPIQYQKSNSITVIPVEDNTENKCSYILINEHVKMICKKGINWPQEPVSEIPSDITKELDSHVKRAAKNENFEYSFAFVTSIQNGSLELLKSEGYSFYLPPKTETKKEKPITWNFLQGSVNPCCIDTYSSGTWHRVCDRTVSC